VNGQTRTRLAAFDLDTGALDGSWKPTADDQVQALVAQSGRIYIGGKFHKINGVSGTARLAAVTPEQVQTAARALDPGTAAVLELRATGGRS